MGISNWLSQPKKLTYRDDLNSILYVYSRHFQKTFITRNISIRNHSYDRLDFKSNLNVFSYFQTLKILSNYLFCILLPVLFYIFIERCLFRICNIFQFPLWTLYHIPCYKDKNILIFFNFIFRQPQNAVCSCRYLKYYGFSIKKTEKNEFHENSPLGFVREF